MFTTIQKLLYFICFSLLMMVCISSCKQDEEGEIATTDGPVLDSVALDGDNKLKLFGKFGDDPGENFRSVIINNIPVAGTNVLSWVNGTIICYVDVETEGEVVVIVRGKKTKSVKFTRNKAGVPQITYLETNETESLLYIYGYGFGNPDEPAPIITIEDEVIDEIEEVGGVELRGDRLIVCRIPPFGPGWSGVLVVTNGSKA
jgi:hypothetical protein